MSIRRYAQRFPHVDIGVAAFLSLFLAACASACAARAAPGPAAAPNLAAPHPTAQLPSPFAPSPFALGINEAVAIPRRLADAMPVAQQTTELNRRAGLSAGLGARFVRGHTGNYPWVSQQSLAEDPRRIAQSDAWVQAVQAAGMEPAAMVSPWPANDTGAYTDSYVPKDMAAYEAYVRYVVERYDGDGIDDMPGLARPVVYWEADNEPDLKNAHRARSAVREYDPAQFCTPAEYAEVFLATARAIKQAFPGAKVLNGGLYKPDGPEGARWFKAFVQTPGVPAAIDILSVHTYHDNIAGDRIAAGIGTERAGLEDKPVWVTETSFGTDATTDAEGQARMLAVLVARAALAGADALFWHSLEDKAASAYPKKLPTFFGYSLLDTDAAGVSTPKPVGVVFRNLAQLLSAHDLRGCTADGSGAARLNDGSVLMYEGSRAVTGSGLNLRTGEELGAGAIAVAPAVLYPI